MVETGGVHFAIAGDAGQLISAQRQAKQAQKELERAMKESAREAKGFEKAAERISRQVETMPEKFARLKREAATVFKSGKLDAETYKKRLRQISQEIVNYNKKLDGAKNKLQETGNESKSLSDAIGGAFDPARLAAFAGGFVGIKQAYAEYMAMVTEDHERAIAMVEKLKESERGLNQIVTQRMRLPAMQERAERISAASGIELGMAQDLVFTGQSEGIPLSTLGRLAMFQHTMDPLQAASIAGGMPLIFNDPEAMKNRVGSRTPITGLESMNMMLAAAKYSKLNAAQMARALPTFAGGSVMAGSGMAESAAIMSVLAPKDAKGQNVAESLRAYGRFIGTMPGLKGKGMMGATAHLEGMTDEERRDIIKDNKQVWMAYEWMVGAMKTQADPEKKSIPQMYQMIMQARAATGTDQSPMAISERSAWENPNMIARNAMEQAKAAQDIVDNTPGPMMREAARRQLRTSMQSLSQQAGGPNWLERLLADTMAGGYMHAGRVFAPGEDMHDPVKYAEKLAREVLQYGKFEDGKLTPLGTGILDSSRQRFLVPESEVKALAQSWVGTQGDEKLRDLVSELIALEKEQLEEAKKLNEQEAETTDAINNLPPVVGTPK